MISHDIPSYYMTLHNITSYNIIYFLNLKNTPQPPADNLQSCITSIRARSIRSEKCLIEGSGPNSEQTGSTQTGICGVGVGHPGGYFFFISKKHNSLVCLLHLGVASSEAIDVFIDNLWTLLLTAIIVQSKGGTPSR